jgi:pseudouridine-5'-phosphate glycosidase
MLAGFKGGVHMGAEHENDISRSDRDGNRV